MKKDKLIISTSVPVLTQIFREEMSRFATPDVKQRILSGLQQKLAAERASQSQNPSQVEQSPGWTTSLGFKAAVYAATILMCAGIVYAANNYIQMQHNAINAGTQDITEQCTSDFLAGLMNVKTEADMNAFKRKWDIQHSNEYISETGNIDSVSAKSVNGHQYFLGYRKAGDSFVFVWEETPSGMVLPDGEDIFMWVEGQLFLESIMNAD
jgi:hypothetical protein